MKRLVLLLIPILLMIITIGGILKIFVFQDTGKGALQVTAQPISKVYLDGTYIGNTPLCKCEATTMIRGGEYTIKLVPLDTGMNEFQEKITITKGVLTVVDRKFAKGTGSEGSIISLTPLSNKKATELLVISFPSNAEVLVDSNTTGNSPISLKNLTISDHTLKVKKDGYKDKNVRIRTPAGYKLTTTVYLGLGEGTAPTPTVQPQATPSAAVSGTPTPTAKTVGRVTILQTPNGFLRVRQQPSLTALEITRVNTGESFTLTGEQTGWYKIKLQDGTEGWISAQFANKQ
jgi:hypothetical protein